MAEQLKEYIQGIAPDKVNLVQVYKGKVNMFEHYGLDKQIKGSFGTTVTMPGNLPGDRTHGGPACHRCQQREPI